MKILEIKWKYIFCEKQADRQNIISKHKTEFLKIYEVTGNQHFAFFLSSIFKTTQKLK